MSFDAAADRQPGRALRPARTTASEVTMLPETRPQSIGKTRRLTGSGGPRDDDQGLLSWALIMLAVGDAVATIFVLRTALYLLGFND